MGSLLAVQGSEPAFRGIGQIRKVQQIMGRDLIRSEHQQSLAADELSGRQRLRVGENVTPWHLGQGVHEEKPRNRWAASRAGARPPSCESAPGRNGGSVVQSAPRQVGESGGSIVQSAPRQIGESGDSIVQSAPRQIGESGGSIVQSAPRQIGESGGSIVQSAPRQIGESGGSIVQSAPGQIGELGDSVVQSAPRQVGESGSNIVQRRARTERRVGQTTVVQGAPEPKQQSCGKGRAPGEGAPEQNKRYVERAKRRVKARPNQQTKQWASAG